VKDNTLPDLSELHNPKGHRRGKNQEQMQVHFQNFLIQGPAYSTQTIYKIKKTIYEYKVRGFHCDQDSCYGLLVCQTVRYQDQKEHNMDIDCLCGLVVRVPGYRSRGSEFNSRRYQIFWEVVGLERGPLSLVKIFEKLFQGNSGSGLENLD
jgi:hypothetical protein